jgi:hypothetical protein
MKIIFAIVFIIIIIATIHCNVSEDSNEIENEEKDLIETKLAKKIYRQLGLVDRETITKDEFKTFFYRVITKDQKNHPHEPFFREVVERHARSLPKNIAVTRLKELISQQHLFKIIEDVIREQYGEEYVPEVKKAFEKLMQAQSEEKMKKTEKTEINNESHKTDNTHTGHTSPTEDLEEYVDDKIKNEDIVEEKHSEL